jgi:hypothetical protein
LRLLCRPPVQLEKRETKPLSATVYRPVPFTVIGADSLTEGDTFSFCVVFTFLDNGYKIRPLCTNAYTANYYTLSSEQRLNHRPQTQILKEN